MITIDNDSVFLRLPTEAQSRILHHTTLLDNSETTLSVRPDSDTLILEPGAEILIYYDSKREFMQQSAKVEALLDDEAGTVVGIEPFGEPVSAESRECYRVSTVLANLKAGVGDEINCPLTDVSVTGFSVHARTSHANGASLRVSLRHEGKNFSGLAVVQSICTYDDGSIRYGLRCVDEHGELSKGLKKISMAVQRQQLKRLAGG